MHHTNGTVMRNISWAYALILIGIIAVSSLGALAVKPANAQTIPKPSAPEFTINYVDRSYDTPLVTRTTTDPYTGKQLTQTSVGEHVENRTVDVKIKNQQYTPVTLSNGSVVQLFYYIRSKGHYANWSQSGDNGYNAMRVPAATSEYTVATFVIDWHVPKDAMEDFQVEALAAIDNIYHFGVTDYHIDFTVSQESEWSPIQTLRLADGSVSNSPPSNPTINATPTSNHELSVPEVLALAIAFLLLCVVATALVIRHRRSIHE